MLRVLSFNTSLWLLGWGCLGVDGFERTYFSERNMCEKRRVGMNGARIGTLRCTFFGTSTNWEDFFLKPQKFSGDSVMTLVSFCFFKAPGRVDCDYIHIYIYIFIFTFFNFSCFIPT